MTTLPTRPKPTPGLARLAAGVAVAIAIGATCLATPAAAVFVPPGSPGTYDAAFNANFASAGAAGSVRALAIQPNGKIMAAGTSYLARVNTDGTLDSGFGTGGQIPGEGGYGVLVQSDEKIVVGGQGLKRFSPNGTPDAVFNANTTTVGFDSWAGPVIQQPSGKIVVGGDFTGRLKRFNTDGTLDTSFGTSGTAPGLDGEVYAMTVQADGAIVVTGTFTNSLRRFSADGVADAAFSANVAGSLSAAINVYSVAVQADQKIIVGYWGTDALQRFNTDGTPDTAFNTNAAALALGASSPVESILAQADGKIVIGGQFNGGAIKRLNANGTIDTGFGDSGMAESVSSAHVWALRRWTDGKLVAGTDDSLLRYFLTEPSVVPTPDAPTGLVASPGDGQATITFTPGADNGTVISNYEYQLDGGAWVALSPADTSSPVTITGLANGTEYQVRLRAIAGSSSGATSDAISVTPAGTAAQPGGGGASPSPGTGGAPADPDIGVSINGGDQYTNDPNVQLKLVWPASSTLARIANDGGFGDAQNRPLAGTIDWRLSPSGPERLPKTVYVRFRGFGNDAQTFTDDIILDQTAPRITRATVARRGTVRGTRSYAISLRGTDRTSGVASFQMTTNHSKPGGHRPFDRSFTYRSRSANPTLYVRIRDRAGNNSSWTQLAPDRRR